MIKGQWRICKRGKQRGEGKATERKRDSKIRETMKAFGGGRRDGWRSAGPCGPCAATEDTQISEGP